ncbi:MAG: hypothetical protein EA421_01610 [Gemmatimonadales bacterium]|nr:MAG: hypothetical protein EA421_01610 [Gemmatimonadales bacterium]
MDCHEARARLLPWDHPRLATPEIVEARAHIEGCTDCLSFLALDAAFRRRLERVEGAGIPIGPRVRILEALAQEEALVLEGQDLGQKSGTPPAAWGRGGGTGAPPSSSEGSPQRWMGRAAVAAVLLLLSTGPHSPDVPAPQATVGPEASGPLAVARAGLVEDFLRRAVQVEHIETSDAREVSEFLDRELGLSARLVEEAGMELARAEVCVVDGVRGAVVIYKVDGKVLYHYLIPSPESEARKPDGVRSIAGGIDSTFAPGTDPLFVSWVSRGVEHALVGELPPEDLLRVALSQAD